LNNAWVNPIYYTSTLKAPINIQADISGLEAGFDVQQDAYNKLGIFGSYRKGDYDLNGKGRKYHSVVGSDIDIDSYIAGLYYRYDRNQWWAFATMFGGVQEAKVRTKDGMNARTDGVELGGSVELGYTMDLGDDYTLDPSLGASYTQIDFNDIHDRAGKTAKYGLISQTEVEAGVKLEKTVMLDEGRLKLYVKPSLVQTFVSGDQVNITGLEKAVTYRDMTLGRAELGGRYALTKDLSAYGSVSYTFGSDYSASSFGLGINYSW
jgi:outer membrane autotransporter protein